MQARILKWKELTKDRVAARDDFESMQREVALREQAKRAEAAMAQQIAQIPLRFRGKSFADYETVCDGQLFAKSISIRFVETFADRLQDGSPLLFSGNPGTGKTLLSLIIYQELVRQGYRIRYFSSLEFIRELLEIRFRSQSAFNTKLEELQRYHLLILDEITESANSSGAPTTMERQILFQIINGRYEQKLPLLVITNCNQQGFMNRLGEPIADRLSEQGMAIAFDWNSYRKK